MAIAFDGSIAPNKLKQMPCGGVPTFDDDTGYAYRCDQCYAIIGSISMPTSCAEMLEEQHTEEQNF